MSEEQRGRILSHEEWLGVLGQQAPKRWPKRLSGVQADSRRIRKGDIFVAIDGHQADGRDFIPDALRRGAVAIVCPSPPPFKLDTPYVESPEARKVLTRLAFALHDYPDRKLWVGAVTGTNGKTSVTTLAHQLLEAAGDPCGLLGTVAYHFGFRHIPARRTTPGAPELQELLSTMEHEGCRKVMMEVSSHALDQYRVEGLDLNCAVFTNLSQDHLDHHGDMENYFNIKARLFAFDSLQHRVVGEDEWSQRLAGMYPDSLRCGLGPDCEVRAENLEYCSKGTCATLHSPWGSGTLCVPLPGEHNLRNTLQALSLACLAGQPLDKVLELCPRLVAAPGRLEEIPSPQGRVLVDYAHTPDAIEQALKTLRPLSAGRLIILYGCGGDRDQGKRPLMAQAAAKHADILIHSSDNPRSEDPFAIFDDMRSGLPAGQELQEILDRKEAIYEAIRMLEKEDILLIAGKGHEQVQEIGKLQVPFDDREIARKAIADLHGASS